MPTNAYEHFHPIPYLVTMTVLCAGVAALVIFIRRRDRLPPNCSRCLGGPLSRLRELPTADQLSIAAAYGKSGGEAGGDIGDFFVCMRCTCIFDHDSATYHSTIVVKGATRTYRGLLEEAVEWHCPRCRLPIPGCEFDSDRLTCPICHASFSWQPCANSGYLWFHEDAN